MHRAVTTRVVELIELLQAQGCIAISRIEHKVICSLIFRIVPILNWELEPTTLAIGVLGAIKI